MEDERYQLVDLPASSIPANQPGAPDNAPKFVIGSLAANLRATTLGDELRLATQWQGAGLWDFAEGPRGDSARGTIGERGFLDRYRRAGTSPLRPTTWSICRSGRGPSMPATAGTGGARSHGRGHDAVL